MAEEAGTFQLLSSAGTIAKTLASNELSDLLNQSVAILMHQQKHLNWKEVPVRSKKRRYGVSTTNIKSVWEMFLYMLRLLTHTI